MKALVLIDRKVIGKLFKNKASCHHECKELRLFCQHSSQQLPLSRFKTNVDCERGFIIIITLSCFTIFPSIGTTVADLTSGRNMIESRKVSVPSKSWASRPESLWTTCLPIDEGDHIQYHSRPSLSPPSIDLKEDGSSRYVVRGLSETCVLLFLQAHGL